MSAIEAVMPETVLDWFTTNSSCQALASSPSAGAFTTRLAHRLLPNDLRLRRRLWLRFWHRTVTQPPAEARPTLPVRILTAHTRPPAPGTASSRPMAPAPTSAPSPSRAPSTRRAPGPRCAPANRRSASTRPASLRGRCFRRGQLGMLSEDIGLLRHCPLVCRNPGHNEPEWPVKTRQREQRRNVGHHLLRLHHRVSFGSRRYTPPHALPHGEVRRRAADDHSYPDDDPRDRRVDAMFGEIAGVQERCGNRDTEDMGISRALHDGSGQPVFDLVVCDGTKYREHRDEHRELRYQGQAPAEWVRAVLLIELHHLLVHLLLVVLILLSQLLNLWRQVRHLPLGMKLLDEQGEDQQPHQHGEEDDGQRPRPAA